jgi:hypothetical protein
MYLIGTKENPVGIFYQPGLMLFRLRILFPINPIGGATHSKVGGEVNHSIVLMALGDHALGECIRQACMAPFNFGMGLTTAGEPPIMPERQFRLFNTIVEEFLE